MSEANTLASQASKLFAGARILKGPEILVNYIYYVIFNPLGCILDLVPAKLQPGLLYRPGGNHQ